MDIRENITKIIRGGEEIDYVQEWTALKTSVGEDLAIEYGMLYIDKSGNSKIVEEYLNMINDSEILSPLQKLWLMNQVSANMFGNAMFVQTDRIKQLEYKMYHNIYEKYKDMFYDIEMADIKDRDESLVFVTTQQFLGLNHGPTKTTLDRARVIKQRLGKKVIIINTAEMFGGEVVPVAVSFNVNYNKMLSNVDTIEYEGEKFPYVQFDNNTPNLQAGYLMAEFVRDYKPLYIVNIGGNSLMLDVCAQMVPVLNVNTVPSNITCTHATAQAVGKISEENPEKLLNILGKNMDSVIFGRFTSSLKPQGKLIGREELGYNSESFVIAVIGGRLGSELDGKFIEMIEPVLKDGADLLIIGKMDNYDEKCKNNNIFKTRSTYLGLQEEVLAILDNVDLYVNPDRTGGGTSVIEAMYKGIPAVTLNHGDVALGAGEDFCVNSYAEMTEKIRKYMQDKEYYTMMSQKAKKRADYMLDSDSAFTDIIKEFETKFCAK